jgi:hypothetical protein
MQLNWRCLVLIAASIVVGATTAQSQPAASQLPPPSEPWSPPAAASFPAQGLAPSTPPLDAVLPVPQAAAGEAVSAEAAAVAPENLIDDQDEANWYQPRYWIDPLPWDTGLELGVNGSSGTSESFSIRTG